MTTPTSVRRVRGFTLIEILAVISIVIVLAALAFPVLSKLQNQNAKATCIHNMRASAQAILLYASESGNFPNAMDPGGSVPWNALPGFIEYAGGSQSSARVGTCPLNLVEPGWAPLKHLSGIAGYPYAVNYNVMAPGHRSQVRMVTVDTPSKRVLMMDSIIGSGWLFGFYSTALNNGWGRVRAPHSGKANIAWCDGHISSRDPNSQDPSEKITDKHLGFGL